ncbi:endonuclease III [Clostridium acetobutylicum]|nr:endonuclease III [Clostridium acetobutylicum]
MEKEKVNKIVDILYEMYPQAKCALDFKTPYELLIATVLSAQCTDKRVNLVTQELFKEYNTPYKMCELTEEELQEKIRTCGLYKNKSKNILEASRGLIDRFNGEVPSNMEELTSLPGVGRKTANVVMSNAFGIPAIAVDTHVFRVSNRIGLAKSKNVYETEKQLMENIDKKDWSTMHHALIWHGRQICKARKPDCEKCGLKEVCNYFKENNK